MKKRKNKKKNRIDERLIYSALAIIFGLLLILYTGPLSPPQCPDYYTQAQVDASQCIVGANIGAGLLFVPGCVLVIVGLWLLVRYKNK